ncbi:hypothetical protein F5B20DRAFT_585976 [Whalleya microplaca]|nr:hypothetical protein F5B20DRAFT_585976 [Whalleya microplaca]
MVDHRESSFSPMPTARPAPRGSRNDIELVERVGSVFSGYNPHNDDQVHRRRNNNQAVIENPLAHSTDEQLYDDVKLFQQRYLPNVDARKLLDAARVAQNARSYDAVARSTNPDAGVGLPVQLTKDEKAALKAEKDVLFSERNMFIVILTVSLAAFLQGFVQSSINGASLYAAEFGLKDVTGATSTSTQTPSLDDWKLGAANASPYIFASVVGCNLSLPINDRIGRRGAMAVAACLIFASSLGAVWCTEWYQLFGIRVLNGVGMGVKAVSTPILASEAAVGFWRGSSILAWQLWVAFGIMIGFAFNLIFYTAERSSRFDPSKAYTILLRLRQTELQALRDIYLVHKSVELEKYSDDFDVENQGDHVPRGLCAHFKSHASRYRQLFTQRRLRNALISSSIVSLAQQLCGINMLAFYSGEKSESQFKALLTNVSWLRISIQRNLRRSRPPYANGAINFVFGLPAIRTIDTLGRRKWLVLTLPLMCLMLMAGALSSMISDERTRSGIIALFIFLFAAVYSPGMGPIPFTLASESFPLSHREAGCAFAISINLLFAGLLSIFFPSIYARLKDGGSLGLFSGLNFVAFILVFLLVEETKKRSLEDLDLVFAVEKRRFIRHQVAVYLPWLARRYLLGRRGEEKPSLYIDLIWKNAPQAQGFGGGGGGGGGMGYADERGFGRVSTFHSESPFGIVGSEPVNRISEDSNDSTHK